MKVLEFTKFPMEFFKGWFWDKNQICFFQDEGSVEEDRLERLEKLIMKRNKRWAGMITKGTWKEHGIMPNFLISSGGLVTIFPKCSDD